MAIATPDEFKRKFPKFGNASVGMIERALAEALLFVSAEAFLDRYEMAVEYKAASLLESGKYGQVAPLPSKGETNEYEKRFLELRAMSWRKGLVL